jgi:dienelactone hydrolase
MRNVLIGFVQTTRGRKLSTMRINKTVVLVSVIALMTTVCFAQKVNEQQLLKILGDFPTPPALKVDTLESVELPAGWRYKVQYVVEAADPLFGRPEDKVRAFLFVPEHKSGEKLPAIVAIHQDGPNTHLGKLEPAGLGGDADQHYGQELFERGYVVICPDRFGHAERRRIPNPEAAGSDMMRDLGLWLKWAGQLILAGRTNFGKETYDLMRAVDVLCGLDVVDRERIGAIGHSAGGNVLPYFMFVDKRVKVGISSCGFFELLEFFNDKARTFANSVFALPGLSKVGKSVDYLSFLAPRPVLLTRGSKEFGNPQADSQHVAETKRIEKYARERYTQLHATDNLRAIYFDGGHAFPDAVKQQVYQWLDRNLKN